MRRMNCHLRWRANTLAAIGLGLCLVLGSATVAVAAGAPYPARGGFELVSSDPAPGATLAQPPSAVKLSFNKPLAKGSRLLVFEADGIQVDAGDGSIDLSDLGSDSLVATLRPLAAGTYSVHWRAVLTDGNETEGGFAFSVGATRAGADVLHVGMVLADCLVGLAGLGLMLFGVSLGRVRPHLRPQYLRPQHLRPHSTRL